MTQEKWVKMRTAVARNSPEKLEEIAGGSEEVLKAIHTNAVHKTAIHHNSIDAMRWMLQKGTNPTTVICPALINGTEEMALAILEFISPENETNGIILGVAAQYGRTQACQKMLSMGLSPNLNTGEPLRSASQGKQRNTAILLIDHGANLKLALGLEDAMGIFDPIHKEHCKLRDLTLLEEIYASQKLRTETSPLEI
jgi:hypothetical protein